MTVSPTREQVFSSLFSLLQSKTTGFVTYSRRMLDYSVIAPKLMPILIMWEQPEETRWGHQGLPIDVWEVALVIVFQNASKPTNGDPTTATPGATIVNPLIDSVRGALEPDDPVSGNLTLALGTRGTGPGFVVWVRVEGRTIVETGDTDADGFGGAVIPVKILVPSQGAV